MSVNQWNYPDSSMGLTFAECVGYMCGAPGSQAQKDACSQAGYAGAEACVDPICVQNGYGCQTTTSSIPAPVPRVTQSQIANQPVTRLTPQTLVPRLPNIVSALAPAPPAPNCTAWEELNGAISEHPVIAMAILAGLYLLLKNKGRR